MQTDIIIISILTSTFLAYRWITKKRLNLPPGPPPEPFIGNVRQLASVERHEMEFEAWGKTYGDIVHAKLFGRSMIVLNSFKAARELMDKRGGNYSSRPPMVLLVDLMGWDCVIPQMPYGERFRKHRRLIQNYFSEQSILAYRPLQRKECATLLSGILKKPDDYALAIKRFSAATIMKIAYGHNVESVDDMYVRLAEDAVTDSTATGGIGSILVDFFPALKYMPTWMPGAGWKRHAYRTREKVQKSLNLPFEMVKGTMANGTAEPSFATTLLTERERTRRKLCTMKMTSRAPLVSSATDTTGGVLLAFFLAMVMFPDVFKKAQEEVDSVVGPDRLPDFDDRPSMPYLDRVLNEVYRWSAPVPLGVPHASIADDEYRGYDIPGGSVVVSNIWAMTRDPELYENPDEFKPERFEDPDAFNPRDLVFGFGRRVCPGKHFGDASLWLCAANMIAAFDMGLKRDENGKEIPVPGKFVPGLTRHPDHFECSITPRSEKSIALINEATTLFA
ncbi:hypothetical protein EVG20_g5603 [Dentipellis fragilis]|uniref:Cytochrome P450 n=1 Tax=Dentipellis fragilis TaxID=205917 RepID=A0A4Y9YS64_9AGAM|nr:hypothetical protein EVG20_g5603 [Dentipellis fragilis]